MYIYVYANKRKYFRYSYINSLLMNDTNPMLYYESLLSLYKYLLYVSNVKPKFLIYIISTVCHTTVRLSECAVQWIKQPYSVPLYYFIIPALCLYIYIIYIHKFIYIYIKDF